MVFLATGTDAGPVFLAGVTVGMGMGMGTGATADTTGGGCGGARIGAVAWKARGGAVDVGTAVAGAWEDSGGSGDDGGDDCREGGGGRGVAV